MGVIKVLEVLVAHINGKIKFQSQLHGWVDIVFHIIMILGLKNFICKEGAFVIWSANMGTLYF